VAGCTAVPTFPHWCTNNFGQHTHILDAWQEQTAPTLQELQQLRKCEKGWKFLCDTLLPKVIGYKIFKTKIDDELVSQFTDPSDIAFVILVLENCWDQWQANPNVETATLWTTTSRMGGGQNTGWDNEALTRYNELCLLEEQDREDNSAMEQTYLTYRKGKSNKKRTAQQIDQPPKVAVYVNKQSKLKNPN
jgi:hypothetical protein